MSKRVSSTGLALSQHTTWLGEKKYTLAGKLPKTADHGGRKSEKEVMHSEQTKPRKLPLK
jgi:hypothetical protein